MSCWSTQLRCKLQLPEVSEEQQSCLDLTARASLLTYLLTYLLSKLENEISGAEGDLPAMAEFLRRTDVRVREALGLGGGSGRGAKAPGLQKPSG